MNMRYIRQVAQIGGHTIFKIVDNEDLNWVRNSGIRKKGVNGDALVQ